MPAEQRNILLVTADSIRSDWCGFVDGEFETTPYLDDVSGGSVVFENAVSPGPRTPSSVPVFLTGEFYRPDDLDRDGASGQDRLRRVANHVRRFDTIPERLSRRGYSTVAFSANPWITEATGFDAAFDRLVEIGPGYGSEDDDDRTVPGLLPDGVRNLSRYARKFLNGEGVFSRWTDYYDDVLAAIEGLQEPWFLWIFLLDTHSPYLAPRRYREETSSVSQYYSAFRYNAQVMGRGNESGAVDRIPSHLDSQLRRSYRDCIRSMDAFVRNLRTDLAPHSPVFLFTSDHGEAFGEHGTYGHHASLYRENVRVPFLVDGVDTSGRISDPVALRSLPSMLTEIADDGTISPTEYVEPFVVSRTEFGTGESYHGNRWKFIDDDSGTELYDLSADPREENECSGRYGEVSEIFEAYSRTERGIRANRRIVDERAAELATRLRDGPVRR